MTDENRRQLMRYRVVVTHESEICVTVEAPPGATAAFLREAVLCMADEGEAEFETVAGDTLFYVIDGGDDNDHGCFIHRQDSVRLTSKQVRVGKGARQ